MPEEQIRPRVCGKVCPDAEWAEILKALPDASFQGNGRTKHECFEARAVLCSSEGLVKIGNRDSLALWGALQETAQRFLLSQF